MPHLSVGDTLWKSCDVDLVTPLASPNDAPTVGDLASGVRGDFGLLMSVNHEVSHYLMQEHMLHDTT